MRRLLDGEEEGERRSATVPAASLINGHLGVQRGMLGRGRECEVGIEVKASGSLSVASDSDEMLSFTESRDSSKKETSTCHPRLASKVGPSASGS